MPAVSADAVIEEILSNCIFAPVVSISYTFSMRIRNSMKNMIVIYACTFAVAILNFVVRRIFLDTLTVDYLGYDGLFTSIFSYLNLSEMGIASIITYHMYSEIATGNTYQIRKLLTIYKLIYRVVGGFVLIMGIAVSFFLPAILYRHQLNEDWQFIYTIYFLQLAATLCTYFLAYRRILFVTHERIYVCTTVDTVISIVSIIARMAVLIRLRNYIAYLIIAIVANALSNLIISLYSRKEYPEITSVKVGREDIRALGLKDEIKNMMATKIAVTIYGASDDIIITTILGVGVNGLASNYRMLSSKLQEFILSAFNSLQASIGNLVYDDGAQHGRDFFRAFDLGGFLLAIVASTGVTCVAQDFIPLWLKKPDFRLPDLFVILLGINLFIAIANNPMNYFRNSLGHFEADRNYMIAAAAVNVILSVALVFPMGISGVMIGTVAGHLLIFLGRILVVHRFYLKESPTGYFLTVLFRFLLLGLSLTVTSAAGSLIYRFTDSQVLTVLLRALLSVLISVVISIGSYCRTDAFRTLLRYAASALRSVRPSREEADG